MLELPRFSGSICDRSLKQEEFHNLEDLLERIAGTYVGDK